MFDPHTERRNPPVSDPLLSWMEGIERDCEMTLSRDLGNGPHKPFGSALPADVEKRLEPPSLITVRPYKLRGSPPCPECGNRGPYQCECEEQPE